MPDKHTPNPQHLDDGLADFTDRLMDDGEPEMPTASEQNRELIALQETVVRLKRAFGSDRPAEDVARRIRANLMEEWRTMHEQRGERTLWARLRSGNFPVRWLTPSQVYAFALLIIVVVVGVVLSSGTSGGGDLSGAAGGETAQGLLPVVFVVGVALGGVIVWWLVRRRRP